MPETCAEDSSSAQAIRHLGVAGEMELGGQAPERLRCKVVLGRSGGIRGGPWEAWE